MIDVHSHILPHMDDGSKSAEESQQLIQKLKEQGIRLVVATPHFYADNEPPEKFLERRAKAWDEIRDIAQDEDMLVRLGAEVKYYMNMQFTDLSPFQIQGTDLLLVEMPFTEWDNQVINEVLELTEKYKVVLAHIERYFEWQNQKHPVWKAFKENGVLFQINAASLRKKELSRKLLKMIRNDEIAFIGSDTHSIDRRPPVFDEAYEIIESKLDRETLVNQIKKSYNIFSRHQVLVPPEVKEMMETRRDPSQVREDEFAEDNNADAQYEDNSEEYDSVEEDASVPVAELVEQETTRRQAIMIENTPSGLPVDIETRVQLRKSGTYDDNSYQKEKPLLRRGANRRRAQRAEESGRSEAEEIHKDRSDFHNAYTEVQDGESLEGLDRTEENGITAEEVNSIQRQDEAVFSRKDLVSDDFISDAQNAEEMTPDSAESRQDIKSSPSNSISSKDESLNNVISSENMTVAEEVDMVDVPSLHESKILDLEEVMLPQPEPGEDRSHFRNAYTEEVEANPDLFGPFPPEPISITRNPEKFVDQDLLDVQNKPNPDQESGYPEPISESIEPTDMNLSDLDRTSPFVEQDPVLPENFMDRFVPSFEETETVAEAARSTAAEPVLNESVLEDVLKAEQNLAEASSLLAEALLETEQGTVSSDSETSVDDKLDSADVETKEPSYTDSVHLQETLEERFEKTSIQPEISDTEKSAEKSSEEQFEENAEIRNENTQPEEPVSSFEEISETASAEIASAETVPFTPETVPGCQDETNPVTAYQESWTVDEEERPEANITNKTNPVEQTIDTVPVTNPVDTASAAESVDPVDTIGAVKGKESEEDNQASEPSQTAEKPDMPLGPESQEPQTSSFESSTLDDSNAKTDVSKEESQPDSLSASIDELAASVSELSAAVESAHTSSEPEIPQSNSLVSASSLKTSKPAEGVTDHTVAVQPGPAVEEKKTPARLSRRERMAAKKRRFL